jgi:hypothetical protein
VVDDVTWRWPEWLLLLAAILAGMAIALLVSAYVAIGWSFSGTNSDDEAVFLAVLFGGGAAVIAGAPLGAVLGTLAAMVSRAVRAPTVVRRASS